MNIENIKLVRDAIADHTIEDLGFNMGRSLGKHAGLPDTSGHNCSTTACIKGWAYVMLSPFIGKYSVVRAIQFNLVDAFGITSEQAHDIVYGQDTVQLDIITDKQAVKVLDHLIETGEVRWDLYT